MGDGHVMSYTPPRLEGVTSRRVVDDGYGGPRPRLGPRVTGLGRGRAGDLEARRPEDVDGTSGCRVSP